MVAASVSLESLCVNSIRMLAVDAVNKSNSGHPGLPMGCAPMGFALWQNILNHNPNNPKWFNRDRFVLSAGHGCMLLYSLLHLTGYKSVSIEDIKEFRQWGSKTPGHPETFETEGVEVTAGPLGAGISNAVGLAIAETHLAAKFNKPDCNIVDHYTYVIMGDGCNQEGIASEACSLAGHLKLGKLIALYDDNQITIDGRTDVSFTEDVYVIIEYFPLVSFITLLPVVLINWVTPNWNELIWIIGIGLFTQLGQTFLTIGLKNLPASEASTINYLQVLFGSIWGILFFSEIININFLLGASLVLLGTIISTTKIIKRT